MNEYAVKKMSEYPTNFTPESDDLIPTITRDVNGKLVNRNIEFSSLKGETGPEGPEGPPGPQGENGGAATVTVGSTETLAPNEDAEVTNSGTVNDAVLNFKIPQGIKGDQGDPGVVQSVNGQSTQDVVLDFSDVGADPTGSAAQALVDAKAYTDSESAQVLQDAKDYTDTGLSTKVDKVTGKGLSTNDYTTPDKNKLAGIQAGAEVNVRSDWNAVSGDAAILNKPTIPSIVGLATEAQVQDVQDNLDAHEADTANPHSVTKVQVGLGNVDNTSDADKPVSTAQQTALNAKVDKSGTASSLYGTDSSGGELLLSYTSTAPTPNTIAQRTGSGQIVTGTPTIGSAATTKTYVDAADALKVNKAGDTMTGVLVNSTASVAYRHTRSGAGDYSNGVDGDGNFVVFDNTSLVRRLTITSTATHIGDKFAPGLYKGTGFPNGVVSAPVGSTYTDVNATNGAIEWKKATGTGNTGWVVSVGDTGWRDVSSSVNGFSSGLLRIKRKDNTVIVSVVDLNLGVSSGSQFDYYTLPSGFGASQWQFSPVDQNLIYKRSLANGGVLRIYSLTASTNINGGFSFDTNAAWPSTLPGTAA